MLQMEENDLECLSRSLGKLDKAQNTGNPVNMKNNSVWNFRTYRGK